MAQPGAAAPQADEQTRRLVIRPEMGADFMQITPQLAEKLFAPIAGAQRTQAVQAEATEPDVRRSTGMPSIAGYGYDVPCNTSANISLRVNGSDWTIPAAKWVVPSGTGAQGMCKTRVRVAQDEGGFRDELYDVLVGSLFLDSIYSAYRYDAAQPQIGFAQLSDKAKDAATSSAAVAQPTASGKSGAVRKSAGAGLLAAAVAVAALTV
ncbi:hypothetical protein CC85DRAFT_288438 [Cutaneotrichosporon oleaginosum]|uniref:Peptidase A1 domain-containing protein n=1 Tax=Cutaneotrichosporon oleaginosum TaxID=879819 RepID=A0A0J0XEM9_9TREE|nr:uncharacterized protein CC85DRAFT_288438 [Cutaneotrichosporon oleaginosum]KLT39521.1 hypothetical protein CC85DRAFT_288438 [Cutaneotrichosporon oleaginosum]TXT07080.1 hypothetical protein COLE_06411 [Cutaneotrichosporon oleaginosum]